MKRYAFFDEDNRVIGFQHLADPSPFSNLVETDETLSGECYVVNGVVLPCVEYTLNDLPLPCRIQIEGEYYECSSQPEFSFSTPGRYDILVLPKDPKFKTMVFEYDTFT